MSRFIPFAAAAAILTLDSFAGAQSLTASNTDFLALDDVEITPDQSLAVVRQNRSDAYALIFDLHTGALAAPPQGGSFDDLCGECLDAVAVTNTRAIVLGGTTCKILDLTNLASPTIASPFVGFRPNDVAITPDGTIAIVRGGSTTSSGPGGQYLFDLASGVQIGYAPGEPPQYDYTGSVPYSFDTDSVVTDDRHAIVLSITGTLVVPRTRVTIWSLHPSVGAPPAIVFETGGTVPDLDGAPHDLALSSNGLVCAVRSELELATFDTTTGAEGLHLRTGLAGSPGSFQDAALDSVETSNGVCATISRISNASLGNGTQLDLVSTSGLHHHDRVPGSPHDFAMTPDGTRVVVRTSAGVYLYSTTNPEPDGAEITPLDSASATSSTTGYQDGLDSVAVTNEYAVTLTHSPDLTSTKVWFWSIARGRLAFLAASTITGSRPTDLTITPDHEKVVVSGNSSISVFHLATGARAFEHHALGPNVWYQWCDGVAATNERAVGIGQWNAQAGWIDRVDMTPFHTRYCTSLPNSTGRAATIFALGDARVSDNRLQLFVENTRPGSHGRFVYGNARTQVPFADGYQCVGGAIYGLRFLDTNAAGAGFLPVNYAAQQIPTARIQPGSTWNFQFVYFDQGSQGFGVNTSDALAITFAP